MKILTEQQIKSLPTNKLLLYKKALLRDKDNTIEWNTAYKRCNKILSTRICIAQQKER